ANRFVEKSTVTIYIFGFVVPKSGSTISRCNEDSFTIFHSTPSAPSAPSSNVDPICVNTTSSLGLFICDGTFSYSQVRKRTLTESRRIDHIQVSMKFFGNRIWMANNDRHHVYR